MTQLKQLLDSGAVQFGFAGQVYSIISNTVSVGGLQYLCPPGRMAEYNYLIITMLFVTKNSTQ